MINVLGCHVLLVVFILFGEMIRIDISRENGRQSGDFIHDNYHSTLPFGRGNRIRQTSPTTAS